MSASLFVRGRPVEDCNGYPQVILTTGGNRWDSGLDVVVAGEAVRVTREDMLRDLAEVWTARWDGRFQFVARDGDFRHADDESLPVETGGRQIPVRSVLPLPPAVLSVQVKP